jgi:cytochrome c
MGNDPLLLNKIAAAVLSAGLLAMLTGFAAHMLYHPKELEKQAYMIAGDAPVAATATAAAVPAGPEPIMAMLASASADAGKKVAKKCAACHSFTKGGSNKVGPNLWNIVGGKPASVTGFKYSGAMKDMAANWEFEELNKFLFKPKAYLKGTKMSFAGLKKASDRAAIIAYLTSLSDSPKPFQ